MDLQRLPRWDKGGKYTTITPKGVFEFAIPSGEFAKRVGLSHRRVEQLVHGRRRPDGTWEEPLLPIPEWADKDGHNLMIVMEAIPRVMNRQKAGWIKGRKRGKRMKGISPERSARIKERREEVAALYRDQGWKIKEIADRLGINTSIVSSDLKAAGVTTRRNAGPQAQADAASHRYPDVKELYESGQTIAQIAEKYGKSTTTILTALRRAGVARRSPGKASHRVG